MTTTSTMTARPPSSAETDQRQLIIIGAGGHAVSVANVALSAGYRVLHFVDANKSGQHLLDVPIIANLDAVASGVSYNCAIAIGDNSVRERVYRQLTQARPHLQFPVLAHASSVVSHFSSVGEGSVLMPGAVVGPNTHIGAFCIINTRASIDHDAKMADFASLAPGAITGGTVHLGLRSAVSIGAVLKHGVRIGKDTVIGANSYVNIDIDDLQVAYGTPARVVRARQAGEPYLA